MDILKGMQVFAAVVESGSFIRAADKLGLSATAASRLVAELERHLGAQLLQRSTRRVNLTEVGTEYYDRCRQILADVDEAESQIATAERQPRGTLRIGLPHSFGLRYVAPMMPDFCKRYPELKLEMNFADRTVDLVEEGIDVAIRITSQLKTSLVARKLAPMSMLCCAAPEYLARYGTPQTVEALQQHNCLTYSYAPTGNVWTFYRNGQVQTVPVSGTMRANSGDMSRIAAVRGLGIVILPAFMLCEDLASGALLPILTDYTLQELNVYAVYQPGARRSARVQALVEFLWQGFGQGTPPWRH